mmetsp:Transcript_27467/g.71113  ORF Transcript_27467/g.71113 Transcript_27467/m.71113 type:complete len:289 (+) Transcript_27467:350-1216(+)
MARDVAWMETRQWPLLVPAGSCAATWTSFFAFVHRTRPPVFLTSCGALPGAALRLSNSAARAASNCARTALRASAGKGDGTFGFVSPRARCSQHRSARKAGAVSFPSDTANGFARSCRKRATQAAPVKGGVDASRAPAATSSAVALAFGAPSLPWKSTTASPPATVPSPSPAGSKTWTFRAVGAQFIHAAACSSSPSTESDSRVSGGAAASPSSRSVQICFWPLADAVRTSWRPAICLVRVNLRVSARGCSCSAVPSLQAGAQSCWSQGRRLALHGTAAGALIQYFGS